ncbi:MAG TPA: class I SAM-dependent methyltransferase [Vicinamibacterales bacterium]|nr:class I SAM-dependent methyltransferase [Vicinamibacterales bacterium]
MFAAADAYERFMGRWSRRLAPLFVAFASVTDADSVLDAGSGTGALASAIADAHPSARVTAVDSSETYVRYAQKRRSSERLQFAVGDLQSLGTSTASFDKTLSLLTLNFVPDRERALHEMIRVTKEGGVVAAAVWDYGFRMEMLRLFWDEAVALDSAVADRDERYMPLCGRGELSELWRAGGLNSVDEQALPITLEFSSFADYWAPFLGGQGPAGEHVVSLSRPDRAALESRLRRRLLHGRRDGSFTLQARAWAVRGKTPTTT